MSFTLLTSHFLSTLPSNFGQLANIYAIFVTLLTSQFSSPLLILHLANIFDIFSTLLTSHLDKSQSKFLQFKNIHDIFLTLLTFQFDKSQSNFLQL